MPRQALVIGPDALESLLIASTLTAAGWQASIALDLPELDDLLSGGWQPDICVLAPGGGHVGRWLRRRLPTIPLYVLPQSPSSGLDGGVMLQALDGLAPEPC